MPKVTVILPTYNRASLLGRAVNSVLSQTFTDFELLVVDDASNDETPEIIRGFSDARVKYICHDINKGEASSRNTGIRNARGEYIAYVDDDDEWQPEKLQKQVSVLDRSGPATGVVYTSMNVVDLHTRKSLRIWKASHRGRVLEQLLEKSFPTGATMLVRTECFRRVGLYDATVRYGPDWEMSIRIARCFDFEVISEPLYNYSMHANQLTANFQIQIAGLQRILELHSDLFADRPKAHAVQLVNIGLKHYLCGDPEQARIFLKKSIRLLPLSVRPYKLFLLSFLSKDYFDRLLALRERASF